MLNINANIFHVSAVGASKNPCSETYAGPKAFSEPETLALSEFIKTFHNLKLYISFHSYSQLLLFPYVSIINNKINKIEFDRFFFYRFKGHSYEHAPNHKDMVR